MIIDIYTTPQCGFCQQLKKLLEEKKMPYKAFDITSDSNALKEMITLAPGNMSVPMTVVDTGTPNQKVAVGFEEGKKILHLEEGGMDNNAKKTALLTCPQASFPYLHVKCLSFL